MPGQHQQACSVPSDSRSCLLMVAFLFGGWWDEAVQYRTAIHRFGSLASAVGLIFLLCWVRLTRVLVVSRSG